jgi:hypothetical protein
MIGDGPLKKEYSDFIHSHQSEDFVISNTYMDNLANAAIIPHWHYV